MARIGLSSFHLSLGVAALAACSSVETPLGGATSTRERRVLRHDASLPERKPVHGRCL